MPEKKNVASSQETLLKVEHLCQYFKENKAVDDVSFSLEKGQTLGLVGESGCGKSTTLSILAGLNNPQSGSFLIDGQETRGTGKDRGVVFQHYSLFPWMSVRKNIEFGRGGRGAWNRTAGDG